jgi:DNA helicase TIP49 (TBP-interacting protein)
MKNLEVRDQILEELKKAITNGELDSIIDRLNKTTLHIDETISKAENYLNRFFRDIGKDSSKIRECSERLVSEHIEKIRVQLIQQPFPLFISS